MTTTTVPRTLLALAFTGLAAAGLAACHPAPTDPSIADDNWIYVGGDEFAEELDEMWDVEHSTYGAGNQELACLRPGNVAVADGTLKIEARKETVSCPGGSTRNYTSGFISTRDNGIHFPAFGRFEIRARVPHAQGMWPAFWLRHIGGATQFAEVDIMEYFHSQVPGRSTNTLHLDGVTNVSKRTTTFESPTAYDWHIWAVEIAPTGQGHVSFKFFLDGTETHSYVDTTPDWLDSLADRSKAWDVAVNMAVGGRWAGEPDGHLGYLPLVPQRDGTSGQCAQSGTFPNCRTTGINRVVWGQPDRTVYEVDFVRIYTRAEWNEPDQP